ncbi:MAG: dienelactone hydrolase family protein [Betaproteobacteria bacterium]
MTTPAIHRDRIRFAFEGAQIPAYIARPAANPRLTVLMLGAIWSVTPHIEDLCDRLAEAGYAAIAPCLFRNTGIPLREAEPEVLAQTFLDFDDCRCIRDLRAAGSAARRGEFGFAPGDIVPWGFCLGGRFAHYLAALRGADDGIAGVVNYYGRLRFARQTNKPFLPAEVTSLIEVPYLGHFAEADQLIPLPDVDELRAALAARNVPQRIEVYAGARHGFVDPERPGEHNPDAAARSWALSLQFLKDLSPT